jgi:hypothetical protein
MTTRRCFPRWRARPDGLPYNEWWDAVGSERKVPQTSFNRHRKALIDKGKVRQDAETKRYHYAESIEEMAEKVRSGK